MFPAASVYNRFMDLEWDRPPGEIEACGGDADREARGVRCRRRVQSGDTCGRRAGILFSTAAAKLGYLADRRRNDASRRRDAALFPMVEADDTGRLRLRPTMGHAWVCGEFWRRWTTSPQHYLELAWPCGASWSPALTSKWWLALLLAYPAQIVARMSLFPTVKASDRWAYSTIMTTSHIAGFQGICKYFWYATIGLIAPSADYK